MKNQQPRWALMEMKEFEPGTMKAQSIRYQTQSLDESFTSSDGS
jgi:hypothetical protein